MSLITLSHLCRHKNQKVGPNVEATPGAYHGISALQMSPTPLHSRFP